MVGPNGSVRPGLKPPCCDDLCLCDLNYLLFLMIHLDRDHLGIREAESRRNPHLGEVMSMPTDIGKQEIGPLATKMGQGDVERWHQQGAHRCRTLQ